MRPAETIEQTPVPTPAKRSARRAKAAAPARSDPEQAESGVSGAPQVIDGVTESPESLIGPVEAMLLSSERAQPAARLAEAVGLASGSAGADLVRAAIEEINRRLESGGRAYRVQKVAGGYRAVMLEEHAAVLARLHGLRESQKITRAGIETLAIIAYRQPITRAEIEAIRGVACGDLLRSLLERRLIAITGRAEELGRPMLYGTTKQFLEVFGLASIKDLPAIPELFTKPAIEAAGVSDDESTEPGGTDPQTEAQA